MSIARVKLFLLPVFVVFIFILGILVAKQTTRPNEAFAQATAVPAECGEKLAEYMNDVIDGAGNLSGIQITSPVFNLTNPREYAIYQSMDAAGADWAGLDAFAGNTYRISGKPPYRWYNPNSLQGDTNPNWRAVFGGKSTIFTEYGNYDQQLGPGNQNVATMTSDFNDMLFDNSVLAAIYFNALNTNTGWSGFALSPSEFSQIIASNTGRAGANSASFVRGSPDTFAGLIRNYPSSARWSLEIIEGRNDIGKAIAAVQSAFGNNINPVLRLCVGNSCGFENPQDLVAFLQELSPNIPAGRYVWVVAGPNEPATEGWAAPECLGEIAEPDEITPFDIIDVPCNETYASKGANAGREFHSLRPYPASPCERNYDETIQTYMCGHDLIAKEVYEVTRQDCIVDPSTGQSCVCQLQTDGSELCTFTVNSSVEVKINLGDAELPIAGNTEDVANAESANSNGLSFPQRVNEYISWYLHGTPYRAEEQDEFLTGNETDSPLYKQIANEIINFSGPIRKLLPLSEVPPTSDETQVGLRREQQAQANQSRHNQIIACTIFNAEFPYFADPVRCYREQDSGRMRLTFPDPFGVIVFNQWASYQSIFSMIPFSSTEDLVGRARTEPRTIQPGQGLGGDPNESTAELIPNAQGQPVTFTPIGSIDDNNRSYHSLYFAHMQEDTELAEYLQNTYLPKGMTGLDTNLPDTIGEILYRSPYCEIVESRTNPGDDLYGEYANGRQNPPTAPEPEQPGGIIEYTARFTCLFEPPLPATDPACAAKIAECNANAAASGVPTDCSPEAVCGQDQKCQKNVLVAMNVQGFTPKATDLWSRLVMGTESVFRRMFPRVEEGAPIDEIEDIPAHANVDYSAKPLSATAGLVGTEALAGDPSLSRSGAQGRLYFPHLGGIHEYFLIQIQKALRPYKLGGPPPIDISPDCTPLTSIDELNALLPPVDDSCTSTSCSGINLNLSPAMEQVISSAASYYKVPASVLLGILYNEGGLNPGGSGGLGSNLTDAIVLGAAGPNCGIPSCEDPGGSYSGARGPWQFLYYTWNSNREAVNLAGIDDGRVPNVCNIVDATFAAARKISRESAGYNYPYTQCAGVTLNNSTQGISTSCNWNASRAVTAAKQYYGLCMDPLNPGALQEFLSYPIAFGGDRNGDGVIDTDDVLDWMAQRNCTPTNTGPCYQYSVLYWFNQCQ